MWSLCRQLIHGTQIISSVSQFRILSFYTPAEFLATCLGMGIDSAAFGLLGAVLRRIDCSNGVALLSLLSVCNSVLALLRVLWFTAFCSCTWYAVLVAWMVVHMHVGT
jgi:hypothetical protein